MKWHIRRAPLAPILINVHPKFKQPGTLALNEHQFCFFLDTPAGSRCSRSTSRGCHFTLGLRNLARQVGQPNKLTRSPLVLPFQITLVRLDRRLAFDYRQFGGDSCKYARWGMHQKMRDAQVIAHTSQALVDERGKRRREGSGHREVGRRPRLCVPCL